ncbi:MAG: hypothetical protein IJS90_04330 [Clostridia bacterium]|nr:hypothetical protein [Clostridia bacterium]
MGKKKQQNLKNKNTGTVAEAGKAFCSDPPVKGYNIYDAEVPADGASNDVSDRDRLDLI